MDVNQWNLDLKRANQAYQNIQSIINECSQKKVKDCKLAGDYLTLARSAPADVQFIGLAQMLAFWAQKGKDHHKKISHHLCVRLKQTAFLDIPANEDVLSWILNECTTEQYLYTVEESIAYLTWLKRFAEAELDEKKNANEDGLSDEEEHAQAEVSEAT